MKKRCKSTYGTRHAILRCDLREEHEGNHRYISWFYFFNGRGSEWYDEEGEDIWNTKKE